MVEEGPDGEDQYVVPSPEYKIDKRMSAWLGFVVPEGLEEPIEAPEWLPYVRLVKLQLNTYGVQELPDDMSDSSIPDVPDEETIILLTPAPEYLIKDGVLRNLSWVASYEDGSRLDAPDTKAAIGVLALIAETAEGHPAGQ